MVTAAVFFMVYFYKIYIGVTHKNELQITKAKFCVKI